MIRSHERVANMIASTAAAALRISVGAILIVGASGRALAAPVHADAALFWNAPAPLPADAEKVGLPARTRALSIVLRLRVDAVGWRGALVSHRVPSARESTFELAATSSHVRFSMKTTDSKSPLGLEVPLEAFGRTGWHDLVVRYDGPRLDLFVDGVWVDEDFPAGELVIPSGIVRLGDQDAARSFRGEVANLAIWARPLADREIVDLSGGTDRVAAATLAINDRLFGPVDRSMQYWRPAHFNVGDALPFFDGTTFHFLYLRDKRHHGSKNGLGAHQWAHATSTDLVRWRHQPTAVAITDDAEGSICTGSMFRHGDTYYAFYAQRMSSDRSEHVRVATGRDGVRFEKQPLFLSPPTGYGKSFRDPTVFTDPTTGFFHMWVTADQKVGGGTLAHLTSKDLAAWTPADPLVIGGPSPECPDHFAWNGWYYMVYSQRGRTRYRLSRAPLGPWTTPESDGLGDDALKVMKTAAFTGNRRLGVAWLNDRTFGGRAVFRELLQQPDGAIGSTFVPEMIPGTAARLPLQPARGKDGTEVVRGVPQDARIRLRIDPSASPGEMVLWLRATGAEATGMPLVLDSRTRSVRLGDKQITAVDGLDRPFSLDVVLTGDIVDVTVDGRRTIISEGDGHIGTVLALSSAGKGARLRALDVRPLK